MPEGDTIYRAARRMNLALKGEIVTRFESVFPHLTRVDYQVPLKGRVIEEVSAVGKHHLIAISGDLTLRTHMRMNGSWHLYRPGEQWRRRFTDMRVFLETSNWQAVGFNVPVAEFLATSTADKSRAIEMLGPDLLGETFDESAAMNRLEEQGDREIAEAILDQRVISGIGNVYKSELLFMRGIHPYRLTATVEKEVLRDLLELSRKFMKLNVPEDGAPGVRAGLRWTTGRLDPRERLYVYGRKGKPCRKCGSPIELGRQGLHARLTYWCPSCQV